MYLFYFQKIKVNPETRSPLLAKHQSNNEESLISNVKFISKNLKF